MLKKISIIPAACLLFLGWGCSTQKNTLISRSYHNLTAHYNVYFNGNESYKKGVATYNKTFRDDYSRILPVYNYGKKEAASAVRPDMETAQKKAAKLITLHSIKAKPKFKRGKLTAEQKEILNINEFNKWVDDAYLLIGKSNFYIQEYDKSTEAFNFTVKEFPKSTSSYWAQIWLARISIDNNEFRDAEKILTQLESDKKFPKKLLYDYYCTVAHNALKQSQYPTALKYLEKALPLAKGKTNKLRLSYIMAQLYQTQKQVNKSTELYNKIIRRNPPYEMAFNAQVNLASLVESGSKDSKLVKQQLLKLARSEKNKDYLDQIYYAIGNVEMNNGNTDEAIEYYKKSVSASKTNNDQKALSCLTLADYFYKNKIYVPAQAYYDSAVQNIDPDYPALDVIKGRAEKLGRLVDNLNIISTQDSVQRIAQMPENERNIFIDRLIASVRQKELDEQLAESQRLQQYYSGQSRQNMIPGEQTQAKWYFYNVVSVNQGRKDFQLRWGKRTLEDNWRRKNKATGAFSDSPELADNDEKASGKKVIDNKTPEFYIQNLPLTDSLMAVSKQQVISAYFEAGQVYRNELIDLPPAIELYEEMLQRFPDNDYKIGIYYQLFSMYGANGNAAKSDYYKNLILTQHPTSTYAQVISDPEFYKQVEAKEKELERFYEQSYILYESGNTAQVIENANLAFQKYPNDKLLANFALLKALCIGKSGDLIAFREELNKVVTGYPKNPVAGHAKDIITFLNSYKPETKVAEDIKKADVIYTQIDASEYIFVVIVDKTEVLPQLMFDMINFNLDYFSKEMYEVTNENFGKEYKIIAVRKFDNPETAKLYYDTFMAKPEASKNIKSTTKTVFFITPDNYKILLAQKETDSYLQFFRMHYLENNTAPQ